MLNISRFIIIKVVSALTVWMTGGVENDHLISLFKYLFDHLQIYCERYLKEWVQYSSKCVWWT